ncbi:hypothetical protein [Nostoc sp.]|uniref:hypothetical protein n=1 Tax=Nostoc sp. TaxID=1180 RepID=UPI003FA53584
MSKIFTHLERARATRPDSGFTSNGGSSINTTVATSTIGARVTSVIKSRRQIDCAKRLAYRNKHCLTLLNINSNLNSETLWTYLHTPLDILAIALSCHQ